MKNVKTCIAKTKVYPHGNNLFRVVIPFDDGSSFQILVKIVKESIEPLACTDRFIFTSLSHEFQSHIKKLCNHINS